MLRAPSGRPWALVSGPDRVGAVMRGVSEREDKRQKSGDHRVSGDNVARLGRLAAFVHPAFSVPDGANE